MKWLILCVAGVAAAEPQRIDRLGDPLPDGAVARLGTARFRHGSTIQALAFAPGGKTIATGGDDKAVALWDAATGRRLRTLAGHSGGLNELAFSPDGRLLAALDSTAEARVWALATGEVLYAVPCYQGVRPAFSGDGKWLVVADAMKQIHVYDAATGKERHRFTPTEPPISLALSPDGKLAAGGGSAAVRLYDVATGKKVRTYERRSVEFGVVAFSPDGKRLVSGDSDGGVAIWDFDSEDPAWQAAIAEDTRVASVGFSADGKAVTAVAADGVVSRHDAATGERLARFGQRDPDERFRLALSPDGKRLALADSETVRVRDLATGRDEPALQQQVRFSDAAWSPTGRTVALQATDGGLVLWEPAGSAEPRRIRDGEATFLTGFTVDGRLVASTGGEKQIVLWDAATGAQVRALDLDIERAVPLGFSSDGRSLAIAGDGGIVVVDPATGKGRYAIRDAPVAPVCPGFSPDGRTFAALSPDGGELRLWEAATGRERGRVRLDRQSPCFAYAPDSTAIATSDAAGLVAVCDLATGRLLRRFGDGRRPAVSLAYSPTGKIVATGSKDGVLLLWDAASGRELRRLDGHAGYVDALAFSPDGKFLLSAGSDTTALVWDVAAVLAARPVVVPSAPRPVDNLWDDLREADGRKGFAAVAALAERPAEAVSLFAERLRPVAPVEPAVVARLLADLDSDRFETRDAAHKELRRLDGLAGPAIRTALAEKPSPDAKRLLEELLAGIDGPPTEPGQLREALAVESLERIATPAALRLLAALAGGAADARLTTEARLAAERLKRRSTLDK